MSYIKESKNRTVYILENGEVKSTDYYSFIMDQVDETTTPRGVRPREFVESVEVHFYKDEAIHAYEYEGYEVEDFDSKDEFEAEALKSFVSNLDIYFYDENRSAELKDFQYFKNSDDYMLTYYTISTWGVGGNNYKSGKKDWTKCFNSEDNAEEHLFKLTEQRYNEFTEQIYYENEEDAKLALDEE